MYEIQITVIHVYSGLGEGSLRGGGIIALPSLYAISVLEIILLKALRHAYMIDGMHIVSYTPQRKAYVGYIAFKVVDCCIMVTSLLHHCCIIIGLQTVNTVK